MAMAFFFGPVTVRNVVKKPNEGVACSSLKSEITIGFCRSNWSLVLLTRPNWLLLTARRFVPFLFQLSMNGCSMSGDPSTCGHVVTSLLVPNGVESRKRLWFTNGSNAAILGGSRQHQKSTKFPMPPPNPGQNSWREFGPPNKYTTKGFFESWKVDGISKDPTKIQVRCDTWQWMILMQTR